MRIVSWNINGVRTLHQYHPWNSFKSFNGILDQLEADIVCFQEMKTSRNQLPKDVALPLPGYDSFFSFPATKKTGYSGVAVYTSTTTAVPLKANEGLTGRLNSSNAQCTNPLKTPLSSQETILPYDALSLDDLVLPCDMQVDPTETEEPSTPFDLTALDSEGRGLMLDFGLFVLINLYCPNETSSARLPFKMAFHRLMERQVKRLRDLGREVMVVGDINVCRMPVDHCDGHLDSVKSVFWEHPARRWMKGWVTEDVEEAKSHEGKLVDVVRMVHPERKAMYTCWNQKISARDTNYGTRIDYFLCTPGLLPWIKGADIQPSVKGSDHCPVYLDLHDEITDEDGPRRTLREAMRVPFTPAQTENTQTETRQDSLPRLAASHWDEYSGKQKLLSSFFGKGSAGKKSTQQPNVAPSQKPSLSTSQTLSASSQKPNPSSSQKLTLASSQIQGDTSQNGTQSSQPQPIEIEDDTDEGEDVRPSKSVVPPKRKLSSSPPTPPAIDSSCSTSSAGPSKSTSSPAPSKKPKLSTSTTEPQSKPLRSASMSQENGSRTKGKGQGKEKEKANGGQAKLASFFQKPATSSQVPTSSQAQDPVPDDDFPQDFDIPPDTLLSPSSKLGFIDPEKKVHATAAWSKLMTPMEPPRCIVHNEAAKEFVTKQGKNKGRAFWVCSRPVGPGYDKGRGTRLREEVDHRYKCDYFKWSSDAKRDRKYELNSSQD